MNARMLGSFCMVGGIAYIINAVYGTLTGTGDSMNTPNLLFGLVWALGAICGWLAIIQLKATGNNIFARLLSFVPVIGISLALILIISQLVVAGGITFSPVIAAGFILELVGALLVGIFTIAAHKFSGWHRFAPFFVVLAVLIGGFVSSALEGAILGIPLFLGIAYILLGYVVRAEKMPSVIDLPVEVAQG